MADLPHSRSVTPPIDISFLASYLTTTELCSVYTLPERPSSELEQSLRAQLSRTYYKMSPASIQSPAIELVPEPPVLSFARMWKSTGTKSRQPNRLRIYVCFGALLTSWIGLTKTTQCTRSGFRLLPLVLWFSDTQTREHAGGLHGYSSRGIETRPL